MSHNCQQWPELVGKKGEEARNIIKRTNSRYEPIVVPQGSMITHDVKPNRVRIFVDREGTVVKAPLVK